MRPVRHFFESHAARKSLWVWDPCLDPLHGPPVKSLWHGGMKIRHQILPVQRFPELLPISCRPAPGTEARTLTHRSIRPQPWRGSTCCCCCCYCGGFGTWNGVYMSVNCQLKIWKVTKISNHLSVLRAKGVDHSFVNSQFILVKIKKKLMSF